jgi:hypothetical protein
VVARDVVALTGHARHAAPESMDEGRACRPVLKCRDGIVVGRAGERVCLGLPEYLPSLPRSSLSLGLCAS